jgi:pterin-4a-carbinolamine dehydratase
VARTEAARIREKRCKANPEEQAAKEASRGTAIWRRAKFRHFIESIKEAAACADCHHHYPACAMDFDHVHGNKVSTIGRMIILNYSFDELVDEIAKCEIVCSNCHRVRTRDRKKL